jgi:plastocyanin
MRYLGMTALAASAIVLAACGGGEQKAEDTAVADTTAAAPATSAAPAATVGAAPITGTTHEGKMVIKYIAVSGNPHNIAIDPAKVPADVKPQLAANFPNPAAELTSPMLLNANDSYTISFGNIKPGAYEFHCTPHLAMNMKQTVTVQ